jgi:hypothetical protein
MSGYIPRNHCGELLRWESRKPIGNRAFLGRPYQVDTALRIHTSPQALERHGVSPSLPASDLECHIFSVTLALPVGASVPCHGPVGLAPSHA